MILTWTCDLCGHNNDNHKGPCHRCGGQTEERMVRGKYVTYAIKKPTIEMRGYYNPRVRDDFPAKPTGET